MCLAQCLAHSKALSKSSLLLAFKAKAESKPKFGVRVGAPEPSGKDQPAPWQSRKPLVAGRV